MSLKVKIIIAIAILIALVCAYFFWYKPTYIDKKVPTGNEPGSANTPKEIHPDTMVDGVTSGAHKTSGYQIF